MQYFLLSFLALPFLWINYLIVKTDIKEKKIPNKLLKYLLLLLPFFYIYTFVYFEINILFFIWRIILTFLISFVLYYFWIWSAWDAKYLLVLALFIPHIWIIPFIWNIALLTMWYLLLYFIWFYLGKCLFNWKYTKSLYLNIYHDLKDKSTTFLQHWDWKFYKKIIFLKILKWILLFLIIFVSIRLARLYIFADIKWSVYYNNLVNYLQDYSYYILFVLIWLFFWLIYLFRLVINKIKTFISKKSKIKNNFIIDFTLISILLLCLLRFIIYEYIINPNEIISYLLRIFTFYILLYLIFKILKYSYKVTFSTAETYYVNIKDLKEGDIVDKEYLLKILNHHFTLNYIYKKNISLKWKLKKRLISWNILTFVNKIKNPIEIDWINKIKNLIKCRNYILMKIKKDKKNYLSQIKILNTFTFWWYIFLWFIVTLIFWNKIFSFLVNFSLTIIK